MSKAIRVVSINDANQNETDFYATQFELLTRGKEKWQREKESWKMGSCVCVSAFIMRFSQRRL